MTMTPDHEHKDCLAMFAKLSEYIDNELDEPARKEIEDHAGVCLPCRACLETLRQTIHMCRYLTSYQKQVTETFSKRLKALIQKLPLEK